MLQFDPRTHRYRDPETGRFAKLAEVLTLVDTEVSRLEVRLMGHARLLLSGKIDIPDFQQRMALSLKESHLRMAMLGGGGAKQLTSAQYGKVGATLRNQYKFLHQFGLDLDSSSILQKTVLSRAKSYAASVRSSYHNAEFEARGKRGFYGKRLLDPQSKHCAACIAFEKTQWTHISLLTPPGEQCQCGGRCRCQIIFRAI